MELEYKLILYNLILALPPWGIIYTALSVGTIINESITKIFFRIIFRGFTFILIPMKVLNHFYFLKKMSSEHWSSYLSIFSLTLLLVADICLIFFGISLRIRDFYKKGPSYQIKREIVSFKKFWKD